VLVERERGAGQVRAAAALAGAYAVAGFALSVAVFPALTTALVHAGWRASALTSLVGVLGSLGGTLALAWSRLPDYAVAFATGFVLARACPEWRWATAPACALGLLVGSAAVTWWCGIDLVHYYRLLLPWELASGAALLAGALLAPGVRDVRRRAVERQGRMRNAPA
jgi:hypothetical protein